MLQVPLVLVGKDYWLGLLEWLKKTVQEKEKYISPQDFDLLKLVDTPEEAVQEVLNFYSKNALQPNF